MLQFPPNLFWSASPALCTALCTALPAQSLATQAEPRVGIRHQDRVLSQLSVSQL